MPRPLAQAGHLIDTLISRRAQEEARDEITARKLVGFDDASGILRAPEAEKPYSSASSAPE